jgi:hypothetical protein
VNVLDENVFTSQRLLLRGWRIAVRHIGHDIGRKGMTDAEIVTLLHGLRRPTLFTHDGDFYRRELCHEKYCLVRLHVSALEIAVYARRMLRHRHFNTQAKRMGLVVSASAEGLSVWRLHASDEALLPWEE